MRSIANKLLPYLALIIILLGFGVYTLINRVSELKADNKIKANSIQAALAGATKWKDRFDREHNSNLQIGLAVSDWNNSQDATLKSLKELAADSKFKDKKIDALQRIVEGFSGKFLVQLDTILLSLDTSFCIDVVDNEWIKNTICRNDSGVLSSQIDVNNTIDIIVGSKKYIVTSDTMVEASSVSFIRRIFKKKENYATVEVVTSNPYFRIKEQKFYKKIK